MPQSKFLKTQAIFLSGIFLVLGGCKQSVPSKIETAPTLSIEKLLANPHSHAHTMVKVSGCFVLGLESVTLRPCSASEPGDVIWVEDARVVQEMQKHRLPDVPDAIPKGLERPAIKKELFTYDERRNADAWEKLKPPPDPEQIVLEVVLLGQFETVAQQVAPETQSGFGNLGAYSHELILADALSNRPAQLSAQTEQTQASKAISTTVCEIVEDALQFVGKTVRFSARFDSDGIERSVLTDSSCGRGIEPFVPDEVEQHPDIEALDRALGQGMRGTIDKRIVATFTGRFVLRDSYSSRLRFVLNIERIDDLMVTPIDLKPHVANQQKQVPSCCEPESEKISQSKVKALVKKTGPIHAPCCADMLHISGTVVLAISVDPQGNVACVQTVSGHPLIIGVTIDSVRRWKFEPYTSEGVRKIFCGQVALRFQANEYGVKYKVI